MLTRARTIWGCRWGAVRLAVASFVLWALIADTGARLARLELASLPDFNFAGEVHRLREAERFGEAMVVADEGMERTKGSAHAAVERERALTLEQQQSWVRRTKDVLKGVVLGADADPSLERLIGAIGADFFVIGDVRDLAIQGWKYLRTGEADGVIAALSAIGIVTTLAPEIDWAPSILKAARRAGAMSHRLGEFVITAVKGREVRAIEALVTDTAAIAKRSSPGTAVRLLRLADDPKDVARVARFVEQEGRAGAFALEATGAAGAEVLRSAESLRAAGRLEEAVRAERTVIAAAGKGPAGAAWIRRGAYRALVRPHPLVGAAKAIWSGHAAAIVQRAFERLDPSAWWAIPALTSWVVFEVSWIGWKLTRRRHVSRPQLVPA